MTQHLMTRMFCVEFSFIKISVYLKA